MRTITVKNVMLTFDADEITTGDPKSKVLEALAMINDILFRQDNGLGAQFLTSHLDNSDIEVEDCDDEDDEENEE